MRRSQISYIKQKLLDLSKGDLIDFAKYTNTWIRPYWPKSEIAEAIISGEKENVVILLKQWASKMGKEQQLFTPDSKPFWRKEKKPVKVEDDGKTFSEEFLERWKKLSTKDEKVEHVEVKVPPRIVPPRREIREERPREPPVKTEIDKIREKIKAKMEEKEKDKVIPPARPPARPPLKSPEKIIIKPKERPKRERPQFPPPRRLPVKYPPGLEPKKKGLAEPEPSRYQPFKTQFEGLKKRIVDRVTDIKDQEKLLKDELVKETEELDKFMKQELKDKGIKIDEKEADLFKLEKKPEIVKKDFDQHLKEIEEKLIVKELSPPTIRKKPPFPEDISEKKPRFDEFRIPAPKLKYDIHTGKEIKPIDDKEEEIELRAKFFDKYIKRAITEEEEKEEIEEIEEEKPPEVKVRKPIPPGGRKDVLGGRVNGRGLINGVVYRKGLVNGYGYSNGLVNGRINGKGLINGMVMERTSEEDDMKKKIRRIGLVRSRFRKRIVVTGLVIFILMALPIMVFMIPVPDGEGILIDGIFDDWKDLDVLSYQDSSNDQLENDNINLIELKINDNKGMVSFYMKTSDEIMAGEQIDDGYGLDTARIFIDFDNENETGYIINDIGADYLFELSGHSNDVKKAEAYVYDSPEKNQYEWTSWMFMSPISAASFENELEAQYWFGDNINKSDKFLTYFALSDSNRRSDFSDMVISNMQQGTLVIEQVKPDINKDILDYGTQDVLKLDLYAYGTPVTVNSIDLDFGELLGAPSDVEIQPGEPETFIIQLNTRDFPQGYLVEIGLKDISYIDTTADIKTIRGLSAKYFIENASEDIEIDGAFADWAEIETHDDVDKEFVTNDNINMSKYKFTQDSEALYFYFEVYGTMMGGTVIPAPGDYFYYTAELPDSDGDGVPDVDDPSPNVNKNSDLDSIPDDYETVILHTDPYFQDTDNDTFWDDVDPAPLDPSIPPIPPSPPPEILLGKDTSAVFIDTDSNRATGFRFNQADIGAEYMIEITGKYQFILEKKLYIFNGENQYDRNWIEIGNITAALDSHRMESSINFQDINLNPGEGFKLFYIISDWSEHKDESDGTIGYEPVGTLRVIGEDIAPGTRVRNRDTVGILKLTFTSDEPNVRIYSITPTMKGTFESSDITSVKIIDDIDDNGIFTIEDEELTSTRLGSSRSNPVELIFEEHLVLEPFNDKIIYIAIQTNNVVRSGKTIGLDLDSADCIKTNVKNVVGNFPMSSNIFTLEMTSSRAPPHSFVDLELSTTFAGPTSATQGDSGVLVLEFTMTATNGNATVSSITLDHTGSGHASDITNVYLEGPFWNLSGSFGTFSFTPFVINDTQTLTFKVYFDISITATVGKFHGVKVSDIGVDSNTKIKGQAKSSEKMEILQIPEFPNQMFPILLIAVVFIGTIMRKKVKYSKNIRNKK